MMKYEAILFDMDGTLLPMEQQIFVRQYFTQLARVLCPLGITPEVLNKGFWGGVGAMMKNDGTATNEEVFWKYFQEVAQREEGQKDIDWDELKKVTEEFYSNEFHEVKPYMGENPLAKQVVDLAHQKADRVILSTNPIFPRAGQLARLSWVGLGEEDFDLITSYENYSYCKPNPKYFEVVCEQMGVNPQNCLVIGNDELEDMHAASTLKMDCYLVTDCQIQREGYEWNGKQGSFSELDKWLRDR